jgi:hypothetical protein
MRKVLGLGICSAAIVAAGLTPTAGWAATTSPAASGPAAGDPSTAVTFAVTTGALAMTVPATMNLGAGAPGDTISGEMGLVTVTDNRALLSAAWTVTAAATNFTTGNATANEIVPATELTYNPGVVDHTGTITIAKTTITMSNSAQTVVTGTAGVGNNDASWTPLISLTIPDAAVGGAYTGTITQSVA